MKILILGYGRSGKAIDRFLLKNNIIASIYDDNYPPLGRFFNYNRLSNLMTQFDLCIRTPGITKINKAYFLANSLSKKIISDLEFSLMFVKSKHLIGVTGSNGKTTTCKLINHFLKDKYNTHVLGNNDFPIIEHVERIQEDDIVILEISSFMLEDTSNIDLEVGIITSLCENHLNQTFDYQSYLGYKKRINFFSKTFISNYRVSKILNIEFSNNNINLDKFRKLVSKTNLGNLELAICCVNKYGVTEKEIIDKLPSFKLDKYRQEIVHNYEGLTFINDSKSTTVESTNKAIEEFDNKPIILILEGVLKSNNTDNLRLDKCEKVYGYGQLSKYLKNIISKETLEEILYDIKINYTNCNILFSPVGASLDLYSSYKERGEHFDKLVKSLWK